MAPFFEFGSNPPPLTDQAILEQLDDELRLQTIYKKDFVAHLKEKIPWKDRKWDDQLRRWSINAKYADVVLELLRDHKYSIEDIRYRSKKWASISWCPSYPHRVITAHYFETREEAEAAKARLDQEGCCNTCQNIHTVELRTVPYARYIYKRWNPYAREYQHWKWS
jgi:hypothetical protein